MFFDNGFIIRDVFADILDREELLHTFTDSDTVFDITAKDVKFTERHFEIDRYARLALYARG